MSSELWRRVGEWRVLNEPYPLLQTKVDLGGFVVRDFDVKPPFPTTHVWLIIQGQETPVLLGDICAETIINYNYCGHCADRRDWVVLAWAWANPLKYSER